MTYQPRRGDIISLDNEKAGALTLSVDFQHFPGPQETDPIAMWEAQSAVRIITSYIARKVSAVPMHLYRRVSQNDRERITGTPLAALLNEPAPGRSWSRFSEQLILDMAVLDRWAVLIVAGENGLVLEHLPANQIAVLTNRGVPQGVRVFANDTTGTSAAFIDVPLDRVIFDVAPQMIPKHLDRGSPRLVTLGSLMAELDETGAWRRAVAQNGPQVPAVIERPVDAPAWSDDAWKRFRSSWDTFKRGGGGEGGTPILEDGMTLRETKVYTPGDVTGTTAVRKTTIEEAAMLYGIPPELIGVRPGNYSNVQAFREVEYVDVLGSWVTNLESAFNLGLRAAGLLLDGEYVEANVQSRLRGAFEEQAQVLSQSVGAPWMTRNEARARQNLPAVEGGDELITPLNVLVGGQPNPNTPVEEQSSRLLPEESADEDQGEKAMDWPWQLGWAEIDVERGAFARDLSRFWKAQHARIVASRAAIEANGGLDVPEGRKATGDASAWVLAQDDLDRILLARGTSLAEAGANQVLLNWNPLSEGFTVEDLLPWTRTAALNNSRLWSTALGSRIADVLADADPARWQAFLDDPSIGRAMIQRYTRTWATEFVEFGRHDAARGSGLRVKTWRTASTYPRASHSALSGTTVAIDDVFPNGARYPGDWAAGADEVANCRCRVDYGRGD